MLAVLNDTRNTQDIRKKRKGLVPSCLSAVWKWGPGIGSHVREDWDFGHVDTRHTLHWLLESTGLWLDLDTHFLLPPQRIVHHSSLSTNTMNRMTCSLKTINPLTSSPHNNRNHFPSDWNSLSNSFQPLRCPGTMLCPFQQLQEFCTLSQVERDQLQVHVDLSD